MLWGHKPRASVSTAFSLSRSMAFSEYFLTGGFLIEYQCE